MTELTFIDFKCPHCGEMNSFPEDFAGLVQECPACSETVIVPADGSDTGRKLPLPLSTPRLTLRRFTSHDWKDLVELVSDEQLFQYVDGAPMDEEHILRWLDSDIHVKLTTPNQSFHLGLETRDQPKLIGYLALRFLDAQNLQAAINIFINTRFQRKGFAAEALTALLGFCFRDIHVHRVTAHCDARHTAAVRLLDKIGLKGEGLFRQDRFLRGEWTDTAWYAVLRQEYVAQA
jgi:RimJ/RimL family protein N-acetyltransferase